MLTHEQFQVVGFTVNLTYVDGTIVSVQMVAINLTSWKQWLPYHCTKRSGRKGNEEERGERKKGLGWRRREEEDNEKKEEQWVFRGEGQFHHLKKKKGPKLPAVGQLGQKKKPSIDFLRNLSHCLQKFLKCILICNYAISQALFCNNPYNKIPKVEK